MSNKIRFKITKSKFMIWFIKRIRTDRNLVKLSRKFWNANIFGPIGKTRAAKILRNEKKKKKWLCFGADKSKNLKKANSILLSKKHYKNLPS